MAVDCDESPLFHLAQRMEEVIVAQRDGHWSPDWERAQDSVLEDYDAWRAASRRPVELDDNEVNYLRTLVRMDYKRTYKRERQSVRKWGQGYDQRHERRFAFLRDLWLKLDGNPNAGFLRGEPDDETDATQSF